MPAAPKRRSPDLGRYRVIHFATHGLLDSRHPELSGIVLSMVDRNGNPQDGFLRLHEIYNLRLNADLVVLSACQTALGEEVRSEGTYWAYARVHVRWQPSGSGQPVERSRPRRR